MNYDKGKVSEKNFISSESTVDLLLPTEEHNPSFNNNGIKTLNYSSVLTNDKQRAKSTAPQSPRSPG